MYKKKADFVMPEDAKHRLNMMQEFNPSKKKQASEKETKESSSGVKRKQTSVLEKKQAQLFKKKNTFDRQLEINQKLMQSRIRGTVKMVERRESQIMT